MKIIHIAESFAGGVYDFIYDLVSGMPEHTYTIIYSEREHTPADFKNKFPDNIDFIHWNQASREINLSQDFKAYRQLVSILKYLPQEPDVIHLHSSKAGFLGRMAARRLGLYNKVIYTPHGVSFLRKDVSNLKHKLFVYLEKMGSLCGGNVVACSASEAEAFHAHNIKATYVNNGIKCATTQTDSNDNNGVTVNKKIRIGTIGRITYPKNPAMFNEIANQFKTDNSVEFVWIGGGGELEDELVSPNIVKTGWISRDEVNTELSQIDIYISTSLWEGLPLSVLQAMCFGKPLLLSSCVGNQDLVKNNYNGMLFNTTEEAKHGLTKMLGDTETLKVFGENSKKFLLENFTLAQTIANYEILYQNLEI